MFISKKVLIVIFTILSHKSYCQIKYVKEIKTPHWQIDFTRSQMMEAFHKKRDKYANILNKLPQDEDLPNFITDKDKFSKIELSLWSVLGTHDCSTFREALFKKVTNKHTLRKIIANPATSLDYIAVRRFQNASFTLPYSRYSLRQLARMRLKELEE